MSRFVEINDYLIDMDEIQYCRFNDTGSRDDIFHIMLKNDRLIDLSTNRFRENSCEHNKNNREGYNKIKKYLMRE